MCLGLSRIAKIPAWIAGCRVFTRPSKHSGKPVISDTSVTFTPAFASAADVPPVEMISYPQAASLLAKSTAPVLSDTLIKAFLTRAEPLPYDKYNKWAVQVEIVGQARNDVIETNSSSRDALCTPAYFGRSALHHITKR
jgi:hypothetical protein